ncbi:MAG TPA: class I SAM-dependent methyltransferase [Spirochaetales bacterium]|nr:class I SAM-dependent methyltransferase [Spirochaetales bacterium]HQK33551.1 class I SAM-dependent methyltransferase [Spirochaetales bacterium]HRV27753.1 class I SAM-dependent methyltransferase [Spirochaetia bacterium]
MAVKTYATLKSSSHSCSVNCPICGSSIVRGKQWNTQGVTFVQCTCGLWRQDPQPAKEEVTGWYDSAYLAYEIEHQYVFRDIALKSLSEAGIIPELIPQTLPPDLLEIGCATGALLDVFAKQGWKTTGVEISKELANYGREQFGLTIQNCTLEQAHFADASFSMIFAFHLIEHLNDPASFIAELYRILRHKGKLVLITPNASSFQAHLMQEAWRSAISDHLFLFSVQNLKALLKTYGFSIAYIKTWGGWPLGMKPKLFKKPLDRLAKAAGCGDVMIIRAQKP